MKINQNGFSTIVVLLFIVIIGLIGGTGWYVWQSQNNTKPNTSESASTTAKKEDTSNDKAKIDTTITDVNISLKTEADINKLPAIAPASFKSYLLEKLKQNTPDEYDCIEVYSISKISAVNIKGGGSSVNVTAGRDNCISGAPRVWALTPSGTWDDVSLNGPMCKSENGGLIYEEFASECYSNSTTDTLVKNPNGSIKSLAQ